MGAADEITNLEGYFRVPKLPEKEFLSELMEKAKVVWRRKSERENQKAIRDAQTKLATMDELVEEHFGVLAISQSW